MTTNPTEADDSTETMTTADLPTRAPPVMDDSLLDGFMLGMLAFLVGGVAMGVVASTSLSDVFILALSVPTFAGLARVAVA